MITAISLSLVVAPLALLAVGGLAGSRSCRRYRRLAVEAERSRRLERPAPAGKAA